MIIPGVGHVVVLGYLATMAISAVETAVVVGGLSALGAALYSIGVPKDSVIQYETDLKADKFLVMAHGPAEEIDRSSCLDGLEPTVSRHLRDMEHTTAESMVHSQGGSNG